MAFNLFGKKVRSQVGIEVVHDGILACTVEHTKENSTLKRVIYEKANMPLIQNGIVSDHLAFAEFLKEFVKNHGLENQQAVLNLPGNTVFTKSIQLPNLPAEELAIIIPQEASRHIPSPIEEVNLDFEIIDAPQGSKATVLIAAFSKAVATDYVSSFEKAGLTLHAIDLAAFSLIRLLGREKLIDETEAVSLCALMGEENTDIVIVSRGMPLFCHNTNVGTKNILEALSYGLEVSLEETEKIIKDPSFSIGSSNTATDPQLSKATSLVKNIFNNVVSEIQKTLEFYSSQNGQEITKVFLAGSGMCLPNADKYIHSRLKVETIIVNQLQQLKREDNYDYSDRLPSIASLIGAGLKE